MKIPKRFLTLAFSVLAMGFLILFSILGISWFFINMIITQLE